ncbi:MAG: bifunctional riboflavin kinase/FMN adenylyltransferase, partial [Pseudomonadota bacterium]
MDLHEVSDALRGGTVAIGNFDGVHRGHQTVLNAALSGPRPAVALTFEPHPRSYFSSAPIFRLTEPAEKAERIAALGLDGTVVCRFDAAFAALSAT